MAITMRSLLTSATLMLALVVSLSHGQQIQKSNLKPQCVNFNHTYCNRFNYSTAIFPNPRGHDTPEEAATEFRDFNTLLNQNDVCHTKLGTLLCFIYFPICNNATYIEGDLVDVGFFPCKELCQEVVNSSCTNHILSFLSSESLPLHLQCNYTDESNRLYYKSEADALPGRPNCINGVAPSYDVNECARNESNDCDKNANCINTVGSYRCVCKNGFTGDGKNCTDVDECSSDLHGCNKTTELCVNTEGGYSCTCKTGYEKEKGVCVPACSSGSCEKCNIRTSINKKTFQRNCYCYALRVTVKSSSVEDCNHVYKVNVKEQYNLQTPYNSTYTTAAPPLSSNDNITVIANPSHCDKCPSLTINEEYLIAGSYSKSKGTTVWQLEGTEKKSLVYAFQPEDDKLSKLSKWIQDGNNERSSKSLCQMQCE